MFKEEIFVILMIVTLLVGGVYIIVKYDGTEVDRLMKQCMQDGHKEYECVSMLRSRGSTYVAPMPIVISR